MVVIVCLLHELCGELSEVQSGKLGPAPGSSELAKGLL